MKQNKNRKNQTNQNTQTNKIKFPTQKIMIMLNKQT